MESGRVDSPLLSCPGSICLNLLDPCCPSALIECEQSPLAILDGPGGPHER